MKRNKKSGEEGGAKWQDTYGDMVTLLLCFFVMLYTISSVDQQKWENLVKSLNPDVESTDDVQTRAYDADAEETPELEEGQPIETDIVGEKDQFDQLYDSLKEAAEELGLEDNVNISQGDGYTFISFRDKVFFDGDSPVLKEEGKQVLDVFSGVIAPAAESIKEIEVIGHTSQGDPNVPNEVVTDRVLSAERSAQVVAYIQQKNLIAPEKLMSSAYGQWKPIATFRTREGRAENRRAEILITKSGSVERSLDEYYEQVYGKNGELGAQIGGEPLEEFVNGEEGRQEAGDGTEGSREETGQTGEETQAGQNEDRQNTNTGQE